MTNWQKKSIALLFFVIVLLLPVTGLTVGAECLNGNGNAHELGGVACTPPMVGGFWAENPDLPVITYSNLFRCRPQVTYTLCLIRNDGQFPYQQDDTVFTNVQQLLPPLPRDSYREYTILTPGEPTRGARRFITDGDPGRRSSEYVNIYYTDDHYASVWLVVFDGK